MKLRKCFVLPVKVMTLENKYFFPYCTDFESFLKFPRNGPKCKELRREMIKVVFWGGNKKENSLG